MGDRHRQEHRRAVHVEGALPHQRAEISGEAPGAHEFGVDGGLGAALRPGQKRPALGQRVVQMGAPGKDFGFVSGKHAAFVPLHQRGRRVDLVGKVVGHSGQFPGADGRGGHARAGGKIRAIILRAPQCADPRVPPDQQHSHMQRPGRQPAAAHGAGQQHQRPDDEHRCTQLARAERERVYYKRKAALDGHRNICEPPVHSGGAAAGDIEQPPRREARSKGQQACAVAAGPAADFFHAERPLVFVLIIKESIAGYKASFMFSLLRCNSAFFLFCTNQPWILLHK